MGSETKHSRKEKRRSDSGDRRHKTQRRERSRSNDKRQRSESNDKKNNQRDYQDDQKKRRRDRSSSYDRRRSTNNDSKNQRDQRSNYSRNDRDNTREDRNARQNRETTKEFKPMKTVEFYEEKEVAQPEQKIEDTDLINSLKENVDFLTEEYNRRRQEEKEKKEKEEQSQKSKKLLDMMNPAEGRAGGVYVPPYKLRQLQAEMMASTETKGEEHQRMMWDLLRKSINGVVNKVNISNLQNVIVELLNENLLRGKGLLARAIIKAQMSSPNFTHIYTALIAVINTKMPDIVDLIIRRVILQFQRSYKRNNKLVCEATIKMLAHLINQKVLNDFVGLQLIFLMLEDPNEDKVDLACQFMTEAGQVLSELTPAGVNAIFERLKGILHEGECEKRIQYSIEHLFAVRKTKFKDHEGVIPELDLVEEEDIITHNYDLLDKIDPEDKENIFKFDPQFDKTEKEWEEIKLEILGEENILQLKQIKTVMDQEDEEDENPDQMKIKDLTDEDRVNLRRTLYLVIMSSVDFEECAHKILKMNLGVGHEDEICHMVQECCQNERTYMKFYGLLAQRFCEMTELYKDNFMKCFVELYSSIHRFETAKIRNSAKFYAHLFYTDSIDWRIFACITLTQDTTTASSRIFIKNLILEICENTGLEDLQKRLGKEEHQEFFSGLFPKDHPRNTRFAINFFISIGLGALTEKLSEHLRQQTFEMQKLQAEQQLKAMMETAVSSESSDEDDSDDSSDDSDESSDDSSDESEDSSSMEEQKDKKRKEKSKQNEKKQSEQKNEKKQTRARSDDSPELKEKKKKK